MDEAPSRSAIAAVDQGCASLNADHGDDAARSYTDSHSFSISASNSGIAIPQRC
jgi:hypothetical protein